MPTPLPSAPRANPPRSRNLSAALALSPVWVIALSVFVGTAVYTLYLSFTASRLFPVSELVGFEHYATLFDNRRWNTSLINMAVLCISYVAGCLVLGFLLAASLDRQIRCESGFRTVFLYPQAVSFVVTGVVWQWLMDPALGLQAAVRNLGWTGFSFDWISHGDTAIYAVTLSGIWQGTGLAMVLLLAGLRGIDSALWQAARIESIPLWRTYLSIILPELRPALATAGILLLMNVIRTYDLVVALTGGGPGYATELPAKFVMDNLFARQNIGLAAAGASVLLVAVLVVTVPIFFVQQARRARKTA